MSLDTRRQPYALLLSFLQREGCGCQGCLQLVPQEALSAMTSCKRNNLVMIVLRWQPTKPLCKLLGVYLRFGNSDQRKGRGVGPMPL